MKVKDLIVKLQELKDRGCGDWQVQVQYRDDGGEYYGRDDDVYMGLDSDDHVVVM